MKDKALDLADAMGRLRDCPELAEAIGGWFHKGAHRFDRLRVDRADRYATFSLGRGPLVAAITLPVDPGATSPAADGRYLTAMLDAALSAFDGATRDAICPKCGEDFAEAIARPDPHALCPRCRPMTLYPPADFEFRP